MSRSHRVPDRRDAYSTATLVTIALLGAAGLTGQTTAGFEKRLESDLIKAATEWHGWFAQNGEQQKTRQADGYGLISYATLHARSKDAKYIEWARDEFRIVSREQRIIHPFHVAPFIEAYVYFRPHMAEADRRHVEDEIRKTLRGQYALPDWGAHNRSIIGAAGFYRAVQAMPNDAEAPKWRRYADALASESWGHWSVEDASQYQALWMIFLLDVGDSTQRTAELMGKPTTRYYFDYYQHLALPSGVLPDFGDGDWGSMWQLYVGVMARAGAHYKNGEYLDCAERMYNYWSSRGGMGGYGMFAVSKALASFDSKVVMKPSELTRSEEVLEDLIGKKIVFRNSGGAYLMLNYRDQGPYGRFTRDHVNQVLAAYEEKPHHGHADENSITHLTDRGTVLLHDGGYRPTGEYFNGWRADVFHNRIVAREGFPMSGDVFDFLAANKLYTPVETEKVHFHSFGSVDYSRTRLHNTMLGYTADRVILFFPSQSSAIVVDSIRVDRAGHRTFANVWHPDRILKQGDGYTVSWPETINQNGPQWKNEHARELLIQFLDPQGKRRAVKTIRRNYQESQVSYEYAANWYFEGQRLTFVTVLRPIAAGASPDQALTEIRMLDTSHGEDRTLALEAKLDNGAQFTIGLKFDATIGMHNRDGRPLWDQQAGMVRYGDKLRTDADFSFVREQNGSREFGLMNGTGVEWSGRMLFDMPETDVIYQGPSGNPVAKQKARVPVWHER